MEKSQTKKIPLNENEEVRTRDARIYIVHATCVYKNNKKNAEK